MKIRTARDLGALIRDRRKKMGLDQLSLAKHAGTSRKWIVEIEKGKPRAGFAMVLRTLQALGVSLDANDLKIRPDIQSPGEIAPSVDINQHLANLGKKV